MFVIEHCYPSFTLLFLSCIVETFCTDNCEWIRSTLMYHFGRHIRTATSIIQLRFGGFETYDCFSNTLEEFRAHYTKIADENMSQ